MTQLDLIQSPPARPKMPQEPIVRAAEIEGRCRWTLRRAWGPGPSILWCGLNPSDADGSRDDPTMLREIGFSWRWGYGSLVKVNLYPFRSPKPAALREWLRDAKSNSLVLANLLRVRDEIEKAQTCVAAWGSVDVAEQEEFVFNLHAVAGLGETVAWKCLGRNANGTPIHTLARGRRRVPDDAVLTDWETC